VTPAGRPAPGELLGEYRIERQLGRGGMGVVYLAWQERLGRRVALKLIAPGLADDPAFRARFEREWRTAAAIEHPNVVPIYGAGELDGHLFIAMRYVDGMDLQTVLIDEGWPGYEGAARLIAQIAGALDAAHARGLVHRDVKPANVMVAGSPPDEHVYLTDFGLTKDLASTTEISRTGEWAGTPDYLAPEQIRGAAVDARVDVYALGCVMFRMLTGKVLFERDSEVGKLWAHVNDPPPAATALNPSLPVEVDGVLDRALAKDPDARFKSAGDLAAAASAALHGRRTTVPERSVATGGAAPARSSRVATQLEEPPTHALRRDRPTPVRPERRRDRSGSSATAIAIVLAALVLTGGGVGAALILTGGSGDKRAGPSLDTGGRGTTAPPTSPPTGGSLRPYSAATYAAQVPAGWTMTKDYELQAGTPARYVTEFAKGDRDILIDTTPGDSSGNLRSATEGLAAKSRGKPGYREIELADTTVGGQPAFRWVFESGGVKKIDIFFFNGEHGYAVLAAGPPSDFAATQDLAERVADSVRSN
jgi:serine/threonine protein kinase